MQLQNEQHNLNDGVLPFFDKQLEHILERRYLDLLEIDGRDGVSLCSLSQKELAFNFWRDARFFCLESLRYDGGIDRGLHQINMQNILGSMVGTDYALITVAKGTRCGISLYWGVARMRGESDGALTGDHIHVLKKAMQNNFLGVRTRDVAPDEVRTQMLDPMLRCGEYPYVFCGIPSPRGRRGDFNAFNGMERFLGAMEGDDFVLMSIAEPVPLSSVNEILFACRELGSEIHSIVKTTVGKMKGTTDTVSLGLFGTMGSASSETFLGSGGAFMAATPTLAALAAGGALTNVATVGALTNVATVGGVYLLKLALATTQTIMKGIGGNLGLAHSWMQSKTVNAEHLNKLAEYCEQVCDTYVRRWQTGKSLGLWNTGMYLFSNQRKVLMKGRNTLRSSLAGDDSHWEPMRSYPISKEATQEYLTRFRNPEFEIFKYGIEKRTIYSNIRLESIAKSKNFDSVDALTDALVKMSPEEQAEISKELAIHEEDLENLQMEERWQEIIEKGFVGHPLSGLLGGPSTLLNTEEVSMVFNVPHKEIQGLSIREAEDFGVSIPQGANDVGEDATFSLGHVVYKMQVLHQEYRLPRDLLNKHLFVCGTTGSGKTNTCFNILQNLDAPFLVIEPTKNEYRYLKNKISNLQIFTPGNETLSPFRINPFEFFPGTNLLTHIDMLKAVFNASFPMYAAMPYILEEAILEIYIDKGWDLVSSKNKYLKNMNNSLFFEFLPTMEDLFDKIESVVRKKSYAEEAYLNYSAALKARISSLLTGSKGLLFNTNRSTPLQDLLKNNVVLEMKYLGDDDEKAFLMGLILSMVYEFRDFEKCRSDGLKHVILLEEAHRLLKNIPEYSSMETSNTRGKSVETFANVISEIRGYGQGVIVVDQVPSKLAVDVIKNTNIKIVHRLLAQDDKNLVGDSIGLSDQQKREIGFLGVGDAVIHREGSEKAILVRIDPIKKLTKSELDLCSDRSVMLSMESYHKKNQMIYARLPGFEKIKSINNTYFSENFKDADNEIYFAVMGFVAIIVSGDISVLGQFKKIFSTIVEKIIRTDDKKRIACHFIYAAHRLFLKINERYPNAYDSCLKMNHLLIDIWFCESIEGVYENIDQFRKLLDRVEGNTNSFGLDYIFNDYKRRRIQESSNKSIIEDNFDLLTEDECKILDLFLDKCINQIIFNIKLNYKSFCFLKEAFIRFLTRGLPIQSKILEKYSICLKTKRGD